MWATIRFRCTVSGFRWADRTRWTRATWHAWQGFRSLDAASYALRTALAQGLSLEHAVEAARSADPGGDLARTVQQLLTDGIVTSIAVAGPATPEAGVRPIERPLALEPDATRGH